jgi:hypothetical protein
MKILSVRQPWAWALIFAGKDIENRSWTTSYRGPIAIHASKGMTRREYNEAKNFILNIGIERVPLQDELEFGKVIGVVDLVGSISSTEYNFGSQDSEWFQGPHGWIVENPKPVIPFIYTGALGLRDFDEVLCYPIKRD